MSVQAREYGPDDQRRHAQAGRPPALPYGQPRWLAARGLPIMARRWLWQPAGFNPGRPACTWLTSLVPWH